MPKIEPSAPYNPPTKAGSPAVPEFNLEDKTIRALEDDLRKAEENVTDTQKTHAENKKKLEQIKANNIAYNALQKEIEKLEEDKAKKQARLKAISDTLNPQTNISEEDQAKLNALTKEIGKAQRNLDRSKKDETITKWKTALADLEKEQKDLQAKLTTNAPKDLKPRQKKKLNSEKSILETQIGLEDQELSAFSKKAKDLKGTTSFADQIKKQEDTITKSEAAIESAKENRATAKEKYSYYKRKLHGFGAILGGALPGIAAGALFKITCTTALTPLGLGVPAIAGFAWGMGYNLYKNRGSEQKGKWKKAFKAGAIGGVVAMGVPVAGELLGLFGDACTPVIENISSVLEGTPEADTAPAALAETADVSTTTPEPEAITVDAAETTETPTAETTPEITQTEAVESPEPTTSDTADVENPTYADLRDSGAIPEWMTEADLCLNEEDAAGGMSMAPPAQSVIPEDFSPELTTEPEAEPVETAEVTTDTVTTEEFNDNELSTLNTPNESYIIPGSDFETLTESNDLATAGEIVAESMTGTLLPPESIYDLSVLLDSSAVNDPDILTALSEEASLYGVDPELIQAVDMKLDSNFDFVMTADSVNIVSAYAETLQSGLEDGTLTAEEYRDALTVALTSIADESTNLVADIAGQTDDVESYVQSDKLSAVEAMRNAAEGFSDPEQVTPVESSARPIARPAFTA